MTLVAMMEVREVTVCLFYDPEAACEALAELQSAGFEGDDVSVISPQERHDKGARAREGAAAGALAAAIGGAALGAGLGAIAGALIRMGLPEDEARYYEQEVHNGRTLLAV